MIERREFISICRQIGAMMEVGVDFLRITEALRSQTDNPRLLQLYEQIDEDLRAGDSLSDAMSHAPDIFSPFAVSLVRQGEARGDIEGAWGRVADFYKTEAREDIELGNDAGLLEPIGARFQGNGSRPLSPRGRGFANTTELFERTQTAFARTFLWVALLLSVLGIVRVATASGLLSQSVQMVWELGVGALFFAVAGILGLTRSKRPTPGKPHCAFCGREQSADVLLSFSDENETAICGLCATQIASQTPLTREQRAEEERERNTRLRGVADALPKEDNATLDDTIILDEDDPLAPPRS